MTTPVGFPLKRDFLPKITPLIETEQERDQFRQGVFIDGFQDKIQRGIANRSNKMAVEDGGDPAEGRRVGEAVAVGRQGGRRKWS